MSIRREISASEFKAKCLALLDEVATTQETIVVTKRGRPVARLVPVEDPRDLRGTATINCTEDELVYFSAWDGSEKPPA